VATLAELRAAIEQILELPAAQAILQLNSNTRERAFEAYVFALVVRAVTQAGGQAILTGVNSGPSPNTVVFRGSPGQIGSTTQDFTYADCTLNGKAFEIHLDVKYLGATGAIHEIDIALVDHAAADNVRRNPQRLVGASKIYGAIECKFFDSRLGTVLGRTFVGLCSDMGQLRFKMFATNGTNSGLAKFLSKESSPSPIFQLSPLRANVGNRLVNALDHELRKWAKMG
jgi:hypothetical protein